MKVIINLNASAEYCRTRAGDCVFLGLSQVYDKCKLFDEILYKKDHVESQRGPQIQRCQACLDTFEGDQK